MDVDKEETITVMEEIMDVRKQEMNLNILKLLDENRNSFFIVLK